KFRRVRTEVGPTRPDAEDHRQAAARQSIRHGAGFPVQEAGTIGGVAGRDRQVGRVRADDDLDAPVSQVTHDRVGLRAGSKVPDLELDLPPGDPTVGIDLVRGNADTGELRAGQRGGVARDREDRSDPDRVRAGRPRGVAATGRRRGERKDEAKRRQPASEPTRDDHDQDLPVGGRRGPRRFDGMRPRPGPSRTTVTGGGRRRYQNSPATTAKNATRAIPPKSSGSRPPLGPVPEVTTAKSPRAFRFDWYIDATAWSVTTSVQRPSAKCWTLPSVTPSGARRTSVRQPSHVFGARGRPASSVTAKR